MRIRTLFPSTLGLLVLASSAIARPPADLDQRVRDFVAASNRQDIDAMLAATEPKFRWMGVQGDRVEVEVVGHDQLKSWLQGYFESTPDAHSELDEVAVDGAYVSAVERTRWRDSEGKLRQQSALSVYQFNDEGRIRDVWYFPAQHEAAP